MVGYNAFDNDPWILKLVDFVSKVLQQERVRIIGVCFGHQIVGRALSAKVGRGDGGWEVSVVPIELTPEGKRIFQQEQLVSSSRKLVNLFSDNGNSTFFRCTET